MLRSLSLSVYMYNELSLPVHGNSVGFDWSTMLCHAGQSYFGGSIPSFHLGCFARWFLKWCSGGCLTNHTNLHCFNVGNRFSFSEASKSAAAWQI